MKDPNVIALERCLKVGNPILFTGAGFSMGAKNDAGDKIVSGSELKDLIITEFIGCVVNNDEYAELKKYSLSQICTYAESLSLNDSNLMDFIREKLSGYKPQRFQEEILAFDGWRKIYTINIDDVVENSSYANHYIPQNANRKIHYSKTAKVEYIKLHGCVRNVDGKMVFTNQQYVDSMLHSSDYRFNSFAQDIQTENFVIIGTEMDEINLDYYDSLFSSVSNKTSHGQLFFINPQPSLFFKARAKKLGATIIEWTTEQFASHLCSLNQDESHVCERRPLLNFLDIRKKIETEKAYRDYKSNIYFGDYPNYKDVVYDWDFINPIISNLADNLADLKYKHGCRHMVALYGKTMSGKSIYLKRIAITLSNKGFATYEYCGKEFDVNYFIGKTKNIPESSIALIVDNASFYYREICFLMHDFPNDKNIIVITASRTYAHFRKRYCLVAESWFSELCVSGETNVSGDVFAENIATRLDEKGLLGKLKAMQLSEKVVAIKRKNDVASFLYDITKGHYYQDRVVGNFNRALSTSSQAYNFIAQLAIFNKMDLPYFPREIMGLIYGTETNKITKIIDDYVTFFPDSNGYMIRNSFLVPVVLGKVSTKQKVKLLTDVLMYISPQVVDGYHSYWNEMASTLMRCRLLRRLMKLSNITIKDLLYSLKNYYNDDYNYWLQVGLAEQYDNDFDHALNHFQQAESLSPKSYLVKNAIARNYLRQANMTVDKQQSIAAFDIGVGLMKSLIREREDFQVKAYSTHCLLYEEVRFFRKNKEVPSDTLLSEMYGMLKAVIDKNPNDPMSNHIGNVFYKFVSDNNLMHKLPSMNFFDLNYIKSMVRDSNMTDKDFLENFEIDA